ncbi:MAG TPA: bifunctional DNA primase/polymerase [Micromonosporaceae bacterium]|jgi:hypothetical protein|nr:bifunctional DNA primase/polymerase [Micromonosporaceae bacterium]
MSWIFRPLERGRLGRAAQRFAAHGWDVVPGARWTGDRYRCDDAGCPTFGCHPATDHWELVASHDPAIVADWWRGMPYTVLLPTGTAFDVIEVPATIGNQASRGAVIGPVAVAAGGRWMFLVRPGDGLRPELADRPDIVLHGHGSWVPAPPTRERGGPIRWEISPDRASWRLPSSYAVQERLITALANARRGDRTHVSPAYAI